MWMTPSSTRTGSSTGAALSRLLKKCVQPDRSLPLNSGVQPSRFGSAAVASHAAASIAASTYRLPMIASGVRSGLFFEHFGLGHLGVECAGRVVERAEPEHLRP